MFEAEGTIMISKLLEHRGIVVDPASELVYLWCEMEQKLHANPDGSLLYHRDA